jgi:hypothetical protein
MTSIQNVFSFCSQQTYPATIVASPLPSANIWAESIQCFTQAFPAAEDPSIHSLDTALSSLSLSATTPTPLPICASLMPAVAPPTLSRRISLRSQDIDLSFALDCSTTPKTYIPTSYPIIFLPRDQEKPSFISPQEKRTLKVKTLEFTRRHRAPWLKEGRLKEFSHEISLAALQLTDGFIASSLGKKALEITQIYLNHTQGHHISPHDHLKSLAPDIMKASCLGQSFAMIVAYSKVETLDAKSLLDAMNKAHVLFFQLTEQTSYNMLLRFRYTSEGAFSVGFIEAVQKKVMATIEEASGWKYKGIKTFDTFKAGYLQEISEALTKTEDSIVEIGLFQEGNQGHSMLSFLTKETALYDSALGFAHFGSRQAFVSDIQRLFINFINRRSGRNYLRAVSLTFFSKT